MNEIDLLITNANLATMDLALSSDATTESSTEHNDYAVINNAHLAISDGKIVGLYTDSSALPKSKTTIDAKGGWITPGLIDCHTHLVWGGNRAREFEWRLQGVSYQEISRKGGGIASTVKATREASDEQRKKDAATRLSRLMEEGVTTVEIKSGYGLSLEQEMRMLSIARQLGEEHAVTIKTTLLAAHAMPPEFDDSDAYIEEICQTIIPQTVQAGLADAVDVFCEGIGFSVEQCRKVFEVAKAHQLPVKGHVEQLSDLKGALLVAQYDGLSVDHIEYLQASDVETLKQSDTVAVLLPGAFYALKEQQLPPIDELRKQAVAMAVSTDLNPGTSPQASLRLAMNQACIYFGLTPAESLAGVTRNAAKALGLGESKGQIKVGYDADLVLWDVDHPCELSYGVNLSRPVNIFKQGITLK